MRNRSKEIIEPPDFEIQGDKRFTAVVAVTINFMSGPAIISRSERVELARINAKMHMLDSRIEQIRKDTQQLSEDTQQLSEDTDSLRAWMSELHHASDQFWQRTSSQFDSDVAEMRDRFLSTFRREFMGDQTVDSQRLINSGYIMALGGNFRVDAFLYQDDSRYVDGDGKVHQPRTDRDTFRLLYGVDPSIAENISKS